MHLRSLAPLALLGLLAACAGPGHQLVPRPDESRPVAADRCRVYVARLDVAAGSTRLVRVLDGEQPVGKLSEDEYLCWDRRPERGIGTVVFEGFAPAMRDLENVFDLPRQPGTVSYYTIEIPHQGHQPQVQKIGESEGRDLIARRKPAR